MPLRDYTNMYAHLKAVECKEGDLLHQDDIIGVMGNTGKSTAAHVHMSSIHGHRKRLWQLKDMFPGGPCEPSEKQVELSAEGLFKPHDIRITTLYNDPQYPLDWNGKRHYALDVVPVWLDGCYGMPFVRWSRSWIGKVVKVGWHPEGYGNYVLINYTVNEIGG